MKTDIEKLLLTIEDMRDFYVEDELSNIANSSYDSELDEDELEYVNAAAKPNPERKEQKP